MTKFISKANRVPLEAAGTLNTLTCSNIYELMSRFFFPLWSTWSQDGELIFAGV